MKEKVFQPYSIGPRADATPGVPFIDLGFYVPREPGPAQAWRRLGFRRPRAAPQAAAAAAPLRRPPWAPLGAPGPPRGSPGPPRGPRGSLGPLGPWPCGPVRGSREAIYTCSTPSWTLFAEVLRAAPQIRSAEALLAAHTDRDACWR